MNTTQSKRLTRRWLIIQLRQGRTIEYIAQDRGMPVVRVCQALEHFQVCARRAY